jgi:uncharacterized protein (DUF1697 family)
VPRYAAFLRGINVGGHRITGEELCAAIAEAGLGGATTFRASGNVVVEADRGRPAEIASRIEAGLERSLGYAVPTFVRTASEVRAMAAHEPFDPALVAGSDGKLQVILLARAPSAAKARELLAMGTDQDRLTLEAKELYWLPSGGLRDSDLDQDAITALMGPITVRTKGTVEQIAAKFFG